MTAFLTSPLLDLDGVRHGFSTRAGGVSRGLYATLNCGLGSSDERERVLQNRAHLAGRFGVSAAALVAAHQAHTPTCVTVRTPWTPDTAPKADALATDVPGLLLAVSTADCVPVLFADAQARVVGAAHAGWRGALAGVLESTIEAMVGLGARAGAIRAAIGPAIRQANYEVGPELIAAFTAQDQANARFFAPAARDGHALFDLTGYVADRLRRAGVTAIDDLGHCTYADPDRFFSYRRATHRGEPDYGRHMHAIRLA